MRQPEQLMALLNATGGVGRVLLSILAGGGLQIGEARALRWQYVDLGTGTLYIVDAKTPKGIRLHAEGLCAGDEAARSAVRAAPESLRRGSRLGRNGHK